MVLATGERGSVVEWIDKKMLLIEVGGVSFPVYADQIDFPYFQDFTAPKEFKKSLPLQPPNHPEKKKRKAFH